MVSDVSYVDQCIFLIWIQAMLSLIFILDKGSGKSASCLHGAHCKRLTTLLLSFCHHSLLGKVHVIGGELQMSYTFMHQKWALKLLTITHQIIKSQLQSIFQVFDRVGESKMTLNSCLKKFQFTKNKCQCVFLIQKTTF